MKAAVNSQSARRIDEPAISCRSGYLLVLVVVNGIGATQKSVWDIGPHPVVHEPVRNEENAGAHSFFQYNARLRSGCDRPESVLAGAAGGYMGEVSHLACKPSPRSWRVYLHARQERDKEIAATLDKMAKRELKRATARRNDQLRWPNRGTQPARRAKSGS